MTETLSDLDAILNDDSAPEEEQKGEKPVEQEDVEAEAVDKEPEKSEIESDQEEEEETPSSQSDKDEKTVPLSALTDERRKRQEAEARAREFEQRASQLIMPDPNDDPEGYAQFLVATRIEQSRDLLMATDGYDDFADMEAHFVQMAQSNPQLAVQMNQSRNPALFAYQAAKEDMRVQKLKDPTYEQELEARIREKLLAELKMDKEPEKPRVKTMPDLTKSAAKGKNTQPKEEVYENPEDVFAD